MPTLTRWFAKASLIYFVAALAVGVVLAARSVVALPAILAAMGPVFFHLFMVGWVTQLIFGVMYWMFPKRSQERPRGSEALAWGTFVFLNLGLILRAVAEPLNAVRGGGGWGTWLAASAVVQWLAGVGFVVNTWPRVKER